jgi:hypothetical protein
LEGRNRNACESLHFLVVAATDGAGLCGGGILASVERVVGWLVDYLEAFLECHPLRYALTMEQITGLDG